MRLDYKFTPDSVGTSIRVLRVKFGLTQTQLGEIVGVSKNTVSAWENGLYFPSISHILALGKAFNVDWLYFFREEENKE